MNGEPVYRIIWAKSDGLAAAEQRWPGVTRCVPAEDERVADGLPVVVDDDGVPVEELLAFFSSRTGTAASTLSQYGRTLTGFADFLQYRGVTSLYEATSADLTAYRLYRTKTADDPIAEYSFRPEAAALRQFYGWAEASGRSTRGPLKKLSRNGRDNLSTNRIRHTKIRHVGSGLFEDLLSAAGEVSLDSTTRSSPERNVAALKTLATTGLRLQELASLLTLDLDLGTGLEHATCVEMEAITKYGVNRNALIPFYATEAIRRYRKTERPNIIARHQRSLRGQLDKCFRVTHVNHASRRVSGVWRGRRRQYLLHHIPVEMRLRAVIVGGDGNVEPLGLFLGDSRGLGMTRSGWEGVFTAINDRMNAQRPSDSPTRKVTPHDLRHTFAINYLRTAQAQRVKKITGSPLGDESPVRDPLIDLQELLGHATAAQTMGYLRYVEDIDRLVAAAAPALGSGEGDGDAEGA